MRSSDYRDVSAIQLTPSAISRLKYIEGHALSFHVKDRGLDALLQLGLIETNSNDKYYHATRAGRDWLEFHKSREWRFWIPIIISIIALIISIIALIGRTK